MRKIEEVMNELSKPFNPADIEFKPQATKKDGSACLAIMYADPRVYMSRLDEVCGGDWSVTYTPWGDRIVCHLTICGVTRSSTGEPDSQSERSEIAGTAAEAQAFKRAGVMFGLGRYLYELPQTWVDFDGKNITAAGKGKLMAIVQEHYKRNVAKQPAKVQAPEPVVEHRNITSEEDINQLWDEVGPMSDGNKPASVAAKGFAWPTSGDALEACANLINYDVPMSEVARKLVVTLQAKHKASNGKTLSDKQYKYLLGLVDKVTGEGSHRAVLSAVCGAPIGDASLPGWQIKELLEWLVAKNPATTDALKGVADSIKNLVAA